MIARAGRGFLNGYGAVLGTAGAATGEAAGGEPAGVAGLANNWSITERTASLAL